MYWINASTGRGGMNDAPANPGTPEKRSNYSLTVEVLPQ